MPGGRLETGESLSQGAAREALEETGLIVAADRLVGIYHCPSTLEGGSAISFVFASRIIGGEITSTAEHPAVTFIPRQELDALIAAHQVRGTHVPFALAAHDAGVSVPLDVVTAVPASAPPSS